MRTLNIIALTLGLSLVTGCGVEPSTMEPTGAGEGAVPTSETAEGEPGQVSATSHTCRFEVWNKVPPGDLNGVIEYKADTCGTFLRQTFTGPNNQYIDLEAWKYGTNYGRVRLEYTPNGYVARFQQGNLDTVKQAVREIEAARAESNLYPKAGTATNWTCIWSATAAIGSIAVAIGSCATPPVGWLICGGSVVVGVASIGSVIQSC